MSLCRWGLFLLFRTWVPVTAADAQSTVIADSLSTPSLGQPLRYEVLLPDSYDSTQSYPVLWLLHGLGGNETTWLTRTQLTRHIHPYPMIVVLPDARRSWYVNAGEDPTARYEDAIIEDLYHVITARYAVDTTRQAIVGNSMGGYGAAMLGLRHPERFRFIGALSAALRAPAHIEDIDPSAGFAVPSLQQAFGRMPGDQRAEHDPFVLYRRVPADRLPYLYLAIGTADRFTTFLPRSREFADSLRIYGARYEYHERPGGHTGIFWDTELPPLLARMWVELTAPRAQLPN